MLTWIIGIAALVFVVTCVYIYANQKRIVFIPVREMEISPDEIGLEFVNVFIEVVPGESINGWYFPGDAGKRAVLFCHGNAGNISHRLETVSFLKKYGVSVFLFDYRGYGNSTGSPGEEKAYQDAFAAYNWLKNVKSFRDEDIIVFGRSLGGAVAVDLAGKTACAGLILESTFTSAADLGQKLFPFLPVRLLLKYKFDSLDKIKTVNCPVLVTHSPDDDIIPYEMGQKLFEAAQPPRKFVVLKGGHNEREYFNLPEYLESMKKILETPSEI